MNHDNWAYIYATGERAPVAVIPPGKDIISLMPWDLEEVEKLLKEEKHDKD
jgi:hypothetical protein